ncbi:MAG: hypothetical protein AB7P21_26225 [Lautropia sp.]
MSPIAASRLLFAIAALNLMPACLAGPLAAAGWTPGAATTELHAGTVGPAGTRATSRESDPRAFARPGLSRLRRSVLCRDGVWTPPE